MHGLMNLIKSQMEHALDLHAYMHIARLVPDNVTRFSDTHAQQDYYKYKFC